MNNNLKTLNTEMEESLQKYVHSENISQVLVAVSVPNQKTMLFTNSKASLNKSEFPIASITKTFTAALTLKLFQQGKLKLDNNLGQYFPQYPKWSNITVQMLLNQTSGLPDYINTPNFFIKMAAHPRHLYSSQKLLEIAYNMKQNFVPGKGWAYSNTNYLLLGLIAEKSSGQSLSHLYNQYFFKPLQLNQTFYSAGYFPKDIETKMMPGFFAQYNATPTNMTWVQGAGGIVSTPDDLIIWAKEIYSEEIPQYFTMIKHYRMALSTGQATSDLNTPSNGFAVFSINTPYGIMWYTPGLASGYRNILAYFPCEGVFIVSSINNGNTQSTSTASLLNLMMNTISKNAVTRQAISHYQKTYSLPAYCQLPKPTTTTLPNF